ATLAELQDQVVARRTVHLVRADHDRLAVLDEGLKPLEPVGPGTGEAIETERAGAPELLVLQHDLLDGPAVLPRPVMGGKVVRGDEGPKALILRGLEEAREVLNRVVFLEAVAEQRPGEAFLAQDIVLRVDDDQGRVLWVKDQGRGRQGGLLRCRRTGLRFT